MIVKENFLENMNSENFLQRLEMAFEVKELNVTKTANRINCEYG